MSNSPSTSGVILTACLTSALTAIATVVLMGRLGVGAEESRVAVPDLAGLSEHDAQVNVLMRQLVFQIGGRRAVTDAKPGTVVSQSLLPGTQVRPGTTVSVEMAREIPKVPDLGGRSPAEAAQLVEKAGLKLVFGEPVSHETIAKGQIVTQRPATGARIEAGQAVTVVLSSGPDLVEVPKLVGLSINKARAALKAAGLAVGEVQWTYDADWGPYAVISQTPKAGERAKTGAAVQMVVNQE